MFDLKVTNNEESEKLFKERISKYLNENDTLSFSSYVGFQKYSECKVKDLDKTDISDYHYMAITANEIYKGKEKIQNAFCCLIDVDADTVEDRDQVINYAKSNYNDIIAIITKEPNESSKHLYGCYILVKCNKDPKEYRVIMGDFTSKFDCVDNHLFFYCFKNPMYKYFRLE